MCRLARASNKMKKRLRYFLIHILGAKFLTLVPEYLFKLVPLPKFIMIEATNACNLRCPLCPTNTTETRKKGLMDIKNFNKLIDELTGSLKGISFNACGEPTLNPKLFEMIAYASSKGIYTMISTNTTLLEKYISKVFDSGLDMIIVCLDGATKKTHESYRIGSNFDIIVKNIKLLTKEKFRRKNSKLEIQLQFVVMRQNEKEIPKIIKLARKLKVDELNLKTVSLGRTSSLVEKEIKAEKYLPLAKKYRRYQVNDGRLVIKNSTKLCNWIQKSFVYWNGDIGVCCYDFNGDYPVGNVFKNGGFKKIWRSDKYARLRKNILLRRLPLCQNCNATSEYGITIKT